MGESVEDGLIRAELGRDRVVDGNLHCGAVLIDSAIPPPPSSSTQWNPWTVLVQCVLRESRRLVVAFGEPPNNELTPPELQNVLAPS